MTETISESEIHYKISNVKKEFMTFNRMTLLNVLRSSQMNYASMKIYSLGGAELSFQ